MTVASVACVGETEDRLLFLRLDPRLWHLDVSTRYVRLDISLVEPCGTLFHLQVFHVRTRWQDDLEDI